MRILLVSVFSLFFAVGASASETVEGVKKDYATFKAEMQTKLDALDLKLNRLVTEGKENGKAARDKAAVDLRAAREDLRRQLEEGRETSAEKWHRFKKDFGRSVDKLNDRLQKALNE